MSTGPVLSTEKVALATDASARFPILSVAVPLEIEIPNVPLPEISEIVTVLIDEPLPDTETEPFAVPVLFKVILLDARLIEIASL